MMSSTDISMIRCRFSRMLDPRCSVVYLCMGAVCFPRCACSRCAALRGLKTLSRKNFISYVVVGFPLYFHATILIGNKISIV